MNKTEISEIRKQFTKDDCVIDRFAACYVSTEKEKTCLTKEAFLSLPEEELFRYLDIFKKALGGTLGKNLINMEFPLEAELGDEGQQKFLLKLRETALKDDGLTEKFFDLVIANYPTTEKYYIVLAHAVYDVPGKAKDGVEMHDMSENIYEYLLCAICPVKLSKPGLGYNENDNRIGERVRDWIVAEPDKAFLFPAFEDRTADIHSMLYYTKKPEELSEDFVDAVFGSKLPLSAGSQKEIFNSLIKESFDEPVSMDIVQNIHENIGDIIELNKDNPEPVALACPDVKRLLEKSGIKTENLIDFEERFDKLAGERQSIMVSNIEGIKKFNITTPDIDIKVKPESASLIKHMVVDGRLSIVIPVSDNVEVNGIPVSLAAENKN